MKSARLHFTRYTKSNFAEYFQLINDAKVMKMITGRAIPEEEAQERFEKILSINQKNDQMGYFMAHCIDNGNFVGLGKLVITEGQEAEIGYVLRPEYWRQGYGTEVSGAMISRAKEVPGINSLMAIIDPKNQGSKRILKKAGFIFNYNGEYYGLPAAYYKMELP